MRGWSIILETTQANLQIAHFIYNSRQLRPVSLAGWIATIDWMLDDLASAASRSALVLTGDVGDETMVSHCTPTAICSYFDPAPLTLHWLVITALHIPQFGWQVAAAQFFAYYCRLFKPDDEQFECQ